MLRLVTSATVLLGFCGPAITHENLQTKLIDHQYHARCIIRDSEVHKVYRSMLVYLQRDLQEWNELKLWVDEKMPLISPSIENHRSRSQANLDILEGVPVCSAGS
ncbi:MAG: hypothetical protein GKR97_01110 [Rhizobiaceae bacterium]|nr:hypothetical protein [Rhizobiaceae bacterium]